jgi:predicted nucleic acid-binding Zn ribbon protein
MNQQTVDTIHGLSKALRQLAECFDGLCLSAVPAVAGVDVRAKQFNREATTPDCPECGSQMKKRTSARGPFWGCGNYPNCKAIRKIGGEGNGWRAENRRQQIERGTDD